MLCGLQLSARTARARSSHRKPRRASITAGRSKKKEIIIPIIDLQRRLQEAGRIRIGKQVENKGGKGTHPTSLQTFRLTSPDKTRVEAAAQLYGGTPKEWDNLGRKEWEVETTTDRLPVVVPPSAMCFTQWYEQWSGGGCLKRCDGQTEQTKEQPCSCDPENPECTPHTRLSVMLSEVPGLGLWRLDTQGWNAARELGAAVETITLAAGAGMMLPAVLRLEQRSSKQAGEGTKRFVVPVLDIIATPSQLVTGELGQRSARAALTPVPPAGPPPSIAEQVENAKAIESRKRTQSMPATGRAPRTAAEAKAPKRGSQDAPPPPDTGQVIDAVTTAIAETPPTVVDLASKEQLKILNRLLTDQGIGDSSVEGKQAKQDWCVAAIGHNLASAADLTPKECDDLIEILSPAEEPVDENLQQINEYYCQVSRDEMLADITQFLQRTTPLESLADLQTDEITAILAALTQREKGES
jgi:hypothetical protein